MRSKGLVHFLVVCALTASLAAAAAAVSARAASAHSTDGGSISAAIGVQVGTKLFNNNANGSCLYGQFWSLPLVQGDAVDINWEASSVSNGMQLHVYAPGVTDFNLGQTDPAQSFGLNNNYKAESTFTASTTGAWILRFDTNNEDGCNDDGTFAGTTDGPGPYDFVVNVRHGVRITTSFAGHTIQHGQPLTVTAYDLAGHVIHDRGLGVTVDGYWGGRWTVIGKSTFASGPAKVVLRIPAKLVGSLIRLQVNVGGPNYQGAAAKFRGVTVR